jgi:biopolymer transport protein ExbD
VHRSPHSSLSELNITPLLDLVFVLLVIFIITTPQLMNNLQLSLPSNKVQPSNASSTDLHIVMVEADGQIQLNHRKVTLSELRGSVSSLEKSNPNSGFVLQSSPEADYQKVVNVLDVFQQLQVTSIGLATDAVEERRP